MAVYLKDVAMMLFDSANNKEFKLLIFSAVHARIFSAGRKKRNNIKNNFSMLCPYLTYAIKSLHKFIFFFSCTFKMKAIPTLHSFHLFIAWEMLCIKLWSVSDLTSEFVFSWSKAKEYN